MAKLLTIRPGLQIGFTESGNATYLAANLSPETVWRLVSEWEGENPDHPRVQFASDWLQKYELPAPRGEDDADRFLRQLAAIGLEPAKTFKALAEAEKFYRRIGATKEQAEEWSVRLLREMIQKAVANKAERAG